jgi:hypothetical protein
MLYLITRPCNVKVSHSSSFLFFGKDREIKVVEVAKVIKVSEQTLRSRGNYLPTQVSFLSLLSAFRRLVTACV